MNDEGYADGTAREEAAHQADDSFPGMEYAGSIARITLRRPREHNRIDPDDIAVLRAYFDEIRTRYDMRAVVITGLGDKTFSSGYTIQAIVERLDRNFEELLDLVENFPCRPSAR